MNDVSSSCRLKLGRGGKIPPPRRGGTSVVSFTRASVCPTTALRALASRLPTKEEAGMSRRVVARPAKAGSIPITLTRMIQTTAICTGVAPFGRLWNFQVQDGWLRNPEVEVTNTVVQ